MEKFDSSIPLKKWTNDNVVTEEVDKTITLFSIEFEGNLPSDCKVKQNVV